MDTIALKRRYKHILASLLAIDDSILVDIMADLYDDNAIEADFSEFVSNTAVDSKNNLAFVALMAITICQKKGSWMTIFGRVIKRAVRYCDKTNYMNMPVEELKLEFAKDISISLYKTGITPELMIFYYYTHNDFDNGRIPFLIEQYKIKSEQVEEYANSNIKGIREINLDGKNRGSLLERQLNAFILEKDIENFPGDKEFRQFAKKYHFVYDAKKQSMFIARGLAWFLMDKVNSSINDEKLNNNTYRILTRNIALFNKHITNYRTLLSDLQALKIDNKRLKRKNAVISKQIVEQRIEGTWRSEDASDTDIAIKENISLKKELYYTRVRIERLEQKIAEYEDEAKINKQIQNDVRIDEDITTDTNIEIVVDLPEFASVVVSGGRWNSKERNLAEELFASSSSNVVFIPSGETIRKQDTIKNADLVIFDMSRHAHAYYYKIKKLNRNILHINKSNAESVRALFE